MSDKPVFIYAATYANQADALADYDSLIELHRALSSSAPTTLP